MKKAMGIICVFAMMLLLNIRVSKAEEVELQGFTYDDSKFVVNEGESIRVSVTYDKSTSLVKPQKGSVLTKTTLVPVFFTSKDRMNGRYYQAVGFRMTTCGQAIENRSGARTRYIGYPQYITVNIGETSDESPAMQDMRMFPKTVLGSTSYSLGAEAGPIGGGWSQEEGLDISGSVDFALDGGDPWTGACLDVTTRSFDNQMAWWEYDYITSSENEFYNTYCYSETEQSGILMWRGEENYEHIVEGFDISVKVEAGICEKDSTTIAYDNKLRTLNSKTGKGTINY